MTKKKTKKVLLIDANSFIHRAFHALPPLETDDGRPTGALYGLANTLIKVLKEEDPEYVGAAFDTPETTFRKEMFDEYKAHRPEPPDELIAQIKSAEELFKEMGVKTTKKPGFEADDVLASLAKQFSQSDNTKVLILTGDLDTLQAVEDEKIMVLTPKRGVSQMRRYDEKAVRERFGVEPPRLADYKGLVGDSSDNIPGVPGIGKKTAESILDKFKTIEEACEKIDEEEGLGYRAKKLSEHTDQATLSKKLATLKNNLSLDVELSDFRYEKDETRAIDYFEKMGFNTLVDRLTDDKSTKPKTTTDFNVISDFKDLKRQETRESDKVKVAYEWKKYLKQAKKEGVEIDGAIYDIKVAAWLVDPDRKDLSLQTLSKDVSKDELLPDESRALEQLFKSTMQKMEEYDLVDVFYNLEMPLIRVLVDMEEFGIKINPETLKEALNKLDKEIKEKEKEIYNKADKEFNLNSPKQIGEVLFDEMSIEGGKKTKTGQYKTSEKILSEIAEEHTIAKNILEYRKLFKIKSTYITPLIEIAEEQGSRVHTTFLQTATATGRLASESPNIQNIPKGDKWAREIRNAFEAEKRKHLISFDYSQLELRILAHVSEDKELTRAIKEGEDVHKLTASKVFKTSPGEVSEKQRDIAKTLNFGVVFGMGSKAFSRQSGLSRKKAEEFIEKYFEDFPGVKQWQEEVIHRAKTQGYLRNENGRIRWFKGGYFERAAINMPIQSLGADIIKKAMLETHKEIKKRGWGDKVKLLLSIHDELLFEVSDDILETVTPIIKEVMEKNTYNLSVPLKVNTKSGKKWGEMS